MEKQGVIKPGLTPAEHDTADASVKTAKQQADKIAELDADFRKRAAETVYSAHK